MAGLRFEGFLSRGEVEISQDEIKIEKHRTRKFGSPNKADGAAQKNDDRPVKLTPIQAFKTGRQTRTDIE